MKRLHIIQLIGQQFLTSNIENEEFSYKRALKQEDISYPSLPDDLRMENNREPYKLDLRFEHEGVSVIIETKEEFKLHDEKQLKAYEFLERQYRPNNQIISILADTKEESKKAKVWKNGILLPDDEINQFDYYPNLFVTKKNNKLRVIETTNELNEYLHKCAIPEKLRSQFIGSCLVALNNGMKYDNQLETSHLLDRISTQLEHRLDGNANKTEKIKILNNVLKQQEIRELKASELYHILDTVQINLVPFIQENTNEGEDLLNLFFTTFNKYVGKQDRNQAFTPTHITDFMSDIVHLNKNSKVLDITCGSGAFLIQAMKKMVAMTSNRAEKLNIKQNQIFGIEKEEKAFGLATTNMLIHQDGKSNILCADCFEKEKWIKQQNIDVILMNPPFGAQKMPKDCPHDSKGQDSTKGFYFVNWVANIVNKGYLATILPLSCAVGSSKEIKKIKEEMLMNHTLEAVFSLPDDIFYPGASVNTCIMLFRLGTPHDFEVPTFFGYFKKDGFQKRKNLGRIEIDRWEDTKYKWLFAFKNHKTLDGFSVMKCVKADDEWLAETHMKTDFSKLKEEDFIQTIRDFISYEVKNGELKN